MERLKVRLTVDDVNQLYHDVREHEPPTGCRPLKGFEQPSRDGEYVLTLWVNPQGEIEIEVRPPRGSYAAMDELSYEAIEEAACNAIA